MDGYYLFELRAREQTIKAQAAEIERLKHSLAVEMGINTEVSKLNLGETVMRKNAEIEQWKAALDDAIELAEEGISYTGSYFTKKWRMQERLDELKSIARSALEKREVDNE
jgi:hypothetical protein